MNDALLLGAVSSSEDGDLTSHHRRYDSAAEPTVYVDDLASNVTGAC